MPRTSRDEALGHRHADAVVREADQHVDRMLGHVPRLHDRNADLEQALAQRRRVRDARQQHAFGTPAQHRIEQLVLVLVAVARQSEQHLISRARHRIAENLHGLGEERMRDRRHDRRDQPRLRRRQPARKPIRHVAKFLHGLAHAQERLRRDRLRRVEHARNGDRRYPGRRGDVGDANAFRRTARALGRSDERRVRFGCGHEERRRNGERWLRPGCSSRPRPPARATQPPCCAASGSP